MQQRRGRETPRSVFKCPFNSHGTTIHRIRPSSTQNQRNFQARTKARLAEEAAAIERCKAAIAEAKAERQRLEESGKHLARVFWVQQALWTQHCRVLSPEGTPAPDPDRALAGLKAMTQMGASATAKDLCSCVPRLPPGGALAERIAAALLPQLSPKQLAVVRASAKEYELHMVPVSMSTSRWVQKVREMEINDGMPACSAAAAAAAQEAALAASRIQDAVTKGIIARKKVYDTMMACLTPEQLSMIE